METIKITIDKQDVYNEVAKATDYTGSKLIDGDEGARERIFAADDDLTELSRFWYESASACNENFKEMLISSVSDYESYKVEFEVSRAFDRNLTDSIASVLRSYFITSIIGQWFKFANKGEAADYFSQAAELLISAERMLYSRRRPSVPK